MNRMSRQFHAMFGIFMVMFYLGIGIFILFFSQKYFIIDRAFANIMGGTFVLYGLYRIFVTYKQLREAFFTREEDEE